MGKELNDLVESVDKLSDKVETKVKAVEEKIDAVVEKDTDYRNDLSELQETVKTWKEDGVPVDNSAMEKAVGDILDKQEKNRLQVDPVSGPRRRSSSSRIRGKAAPTSRT